MARDQEELRRLMRERMTDSGSEHKSPFAKILSTGKIFCIVCPGVSIKTWSTHQMSAQHKRNVNSHNATRAMPPPAASRKLEPPRKIPEPPKIAPKSILKNPLKAPKAQAAVEQHKTAAPSETLKRPAEPSEDQPESRRQKISGDAPKAGDVSKVDEASRAENGSALPEGFFDDPKLDAKARNIEYKDPKEAEWEMFQKELREEGSKSEQVVEIDEENDLRERELQEADEMISKWEKVRELEIRKDQLKKVDDSEQKISMEEDDEAEFAEFLDWRQKAVD